MSSAREEVLARVRAAISAGEPAASPTRSYRRRGELDVRGRIELLCERIREYRAEASVIVARDLPGAIGEVCVRNSAERLVIPADIPPEWRPEGVELIEDDGLSAVALDKLDGVLTGSTVAIAQTGTIVLAGGRREGRRALTLVPDLHICVVAGDQIVELVPQGFDALAASARCPLTFISGPSATSDIELDRVEGVHGPRRLVVLVVTDGLA